jgi:hypothetical protein
MKTLILRGMVRCSIVIASALYLGGCSEYFDRRDTLRRSAGEAVQNNVIVHTIDPWPRHAFIVPKITSGERTQRAVERYRNPGAGLGSAQMPPTATRSGDLAQPR